MPGQRKNIPAATEAALWVLSNGTCYAPGCSAPVMTEVRESVYRKNAQVSHIYGVRPTAPRFRKDLSDSQRDSFANLLLLCLPHHGEVDDRKTGEQLYPPAMLFSWKKAHEGSNAKPLAALGTLREDDLDELLASVFTPPLERLEAIAERLEKTGTVTEAPLKN